MRGIIFFTGVKEFRASLGVLFLRIVVGGQLLIGHGLPKWEKKSVLKSDWFVPSFFPFSQMTSEQSFYATLFSEIICSSLLIIGLWTRFSLLVLGFTFYVAIFQVHGADPWFLGPGIKVAKEPAFLYFAMIITLFVTGPGKFSMDARIH